MHPRTAAHVLADGRLDYDEDLLGRFDYVIGSIHSRFRMDGAAITDRVLRAMDDPHMTILAHPAGRLLLSREPCALDVEFVLQKAAQVGVAIEIGPDAFGWQPGVDGSRRGVGAQGVADAGDVLNTRTADDVVAFARRRQQ